MTKTHITRPWIITIFVVILLIAMIVIWALLGEFNVLHQQWLIAKNGVLWKGKITDNNKDWLFKIFGRYMNDPNDINNNVGSYKKIISNQLIIKPLIFIPLVSCVALAIAIPFLFKPFHIMNIDVLPYSVTICFSFFVLIVSGLIPHWKNSDILLWVIRLLVLLSCMFICFILVNKLTNKFLIKTNYANAVVNEFNKIEQEKKPYRNSLKNLEEQVKQKDKMEYVEE